MNKRLRKKRTKNESLKLVKDLGIDTPGFKKEFILADSNGFFNICITNNDLTITIDNVEDEAKISIYLNVIPEYDEVYHEIYVEDISLARNELRNAIIEIETHKVQHFVNVNLGRGYCDIESLSEYLIKHDLKLDSLYKKYVNELKLYKEDELKEHIYNIQKIKKLDTRIKRILCINSSEYVLIFSEKITKPEFKKIYDKSKNEKYYLSNNYIM